MLHFTSWTFICFYTFSSDGCVNTFWALLSLLLHVIMSVMFLIRYMILREWQRRVVLHRHVVLLYMNVVCGRYCVPVFARAYRYYLCSDFVRIEWRRIANVVSPIRSNFYYLFITHNMQLVNLAVFCVLPTINSNRSSRIDILRIDRYYLCSKYIIIKWQRIKQVVLFREIFTLSPIRELKITLRRTSNI